MPTARSETEVHAEPVDVAHALFATRIGMCALAWNAQAILAVHLPHASAGATRDSMLELLAQRLRKAGWVMRATAPPVAQWAHWPLHVRQAVAGVQVLLAGRRAQAESSADCAAPWCASVAEGVLGDVRAQYLRADGADAVAGASMNGASALPQLREIALDWRGVPEFARQVYALTQAIAPGETRTYGDLAQALGGPGLARAVGQALGANPFAPIVPCHRVLGAGREPGGFSGGGGALTKLRMLELEGAAWGGSRSLFE